MFVGVVCVNMPVGVWEADGLCALPPRQESRQKQQRDLHALVLTNWALLAFESCLGWQLVASCS